MTEEAGLATVFNLKVEFEKVYLPDSDIEIELRRPGQRAIEETLQDYTKVAKDKGTDHKMGCFLLQRFWDSDTVHGKELDQLEEELKEIKDNDVTAIIDWFMRHTRLGKQYFQALNGGDVDFRSPTKSEDS